MNTRSKKGYALAMSIIFIIIVTIIGFGLYTSVEHFVKEIKLRETEYIKGHYSAVAGLRYAALLLGDPESSYFNFTTPAVHDGEEYTVTGNELGEDFFGDIGVNSSDLVITITEWDDTEADWTQDEYSVSAAYSAN